MVYNISEAPFTLIPELSGRAGILGNRIYSVYTGITRYTDDYGETFTDLPNNLPDFGADYYVHFSRDGTMFVSRSRQFFRAESPYTDFTNVVNFSTTGSVINTWGFTEDSDGVLYISEYGNYVDVENGGYVNLLYWYKSINKGLSWTRYDNLKHTDTKHIHQIKVNPYTDELYITTGDRDKRLFKSTDKGESFTEVVPTVYPDQTAENINYGGFTGVGFYPDGSILWGTDWQPTKDGQYWNWFVKSQGTDVNSFSYAPMEKKYYGFCGELITDPNTGEAWTLLRDEFGEDDVVSAVMYSEDFGESWKPLVETDLVSTLQMETMFRTQENFIADMPYIFLSVLNYGVVRFDRNLKPENDNEYIPGYLKNATVYLRVDGRLRKGNVMGARKVLAN